MNDAMNFEPSWVQAEVARTARAFAARELAPRAAERDRRALFPEAEMRALGTLGLLGLCVPEEHGGAAAGPVALALAVSEIAEADAAVAVTMSVTNMVGEIIARYGTAAARQRLLPRLCSGEAVAGAFALSEPQSGSDAGAMATAARRVAGGYLLRGTKQWITSGDRAGVLVVMARDADSAEARSISAFALEPPLPGLTSGRHERKMGQRGSSTVALALDDVFVSEEGLLGRPGEGFKVALTALDGGRIAVGAQAAGIARAALRVAVAHARTRQSRRNAGGSAAGVPSREVWNPVRVPDQGVKHMIADCATACEAAWLLVLQAAWTKERGRPFTRLAAEAKLMASERAFEACDRSLQILGGYGYTRELPVERYWRDVRVTTIYEGTSQIQKLVIAKHILRELEAHHV
jgi:alkylation response protein AidB-like acyl-CoA dehydrogenase